MKYNRRDAEDAESKERKRLFCLCPFLVFSVLSASLRLTLSGPESAFGHSLDELELRQLGHRPEEIGDAGRRHFFAAQDLAGEAQLVRGWVARQAVPEDSGIQPLGSFAASGASFWAIFFSRPSS